MSTCRIVYVAYEGDEPGPVLEALERLIAGAGEAAHPLDGPDEPREPRKPGVCEGCGARCPMLVFPGRRWLCPACAKVEFGVTGAGSTPAAPSVDRPSPRPSPRGPERPRGEGAKTEPATAPETEPELEPTPRRALTIDDSGAVVGERDLRTVEEAGERGSWDRVVGGAAGAAGGMVPPVAPPPIGKAMRIPAAGGTPAAPVETAGGSAPAATGDKPAGGRRDLPSPLDALLAALPTVGDRRRLIDLSPDDQNRRTRLRQAAERDGRFRYESLGARRPAWVRRVKP